MLYNMLNQELSCFAMNRMLSAEATIFFPLEPIWSSSFVFHRGIITLSTAITC
jgi:hypothetical protein